MKRHHPMLMLLDIWKMGRNVLFFVITFFIIKHQSGETFFTYGRLVVLLAIVASLILTVLKWASKKYEVDDRSFHLYEGIFTKTNRTIPFSKVENTNQHTSLFHRLTGMTSLTFETGMSGDEAAVEFEVISTKEADRLKQKVTENTELEEVERVVEA
ncbi:MAG: PH domain-containing protein, partial [Anaerobacillus sp.]